MTQSLQNARLHLLVFLAGVFVASSPAAAAELFVTDNRNDDVVHRFNTTTGNSDLADIALLGASGLAVGPDGNLYAASTTSAEVFRYNATTGAQIGSGPFVSFNGLNDGHDVQNPQGMRFGPNGNLYIADVTSSNVHIYSPTGASLGTLENNGGIPPPLVQPTDVAFDSSGNLYVVSGEADVLRFTLTAGGTQQSVSEFVHQQAGGITNPTSLTFGPVPMLNYLSWISAAHRRGFIAIRRAAHRTEPSSRSPAAARLERSCRPISSSAPMAVCTFRASI